MNSYPEFKKRPTYPLTTKTNIRYVWDFITCGIGFKWALTPLSKCIYINKQELGQQQTSLKKAIAFLQINNIEFCLCDQVKIIV